MKTALVCGKWDLPLLEGEANLLEGGAKGYYEYINDRPWETGRNALCVEWLLNKLPKGRHVLEPFGGVGVFSTIVQNVLQPRYHDIFDIDKDCLAQLEHAFANRAGVQVARGDARDILQRVRTDIYVLDFPFQTITIYPQWEQQWKNIFEAKPLAVMWMDGASRYMHFHKERYSKRFERTVETCEDYAQAMSEFMYAQHGYSITSCAWSSGCFYFLAEEMPPSNKIDFHRVSSGAGGLSIRDH